MCIRDSPSSPGQRVVKQVCVTCREKYNSDEPANALSMPFILPVQPATFCCSVARSLSTRPASRTSNAVCSSCCWTLNTSFTWSSWAAACRDNRLRSSHSRSTADSSTCHGKKGKGSPYSITELRVPELIPVLGSQPAEPGGRLPLLFARLAVTPTTFKRAGTNLTAWWTEAQWVWAVCLRLLPDSDGNKLSIITLNHSAVNGNDIPSADTNTTAWIGSFFITKILKKNRFIALAISNIPISQGSVAMHLIWGGQYLNKFRKCFQWNLLVNNYENWLTFDSVIGKIMRVFSMQT